MKRILVKILQNSQGNNCPGVVEIGFDTDASPEF